MGKGFVRQTTISVQIKRPEKEIFYVVSYCMKCNEHRLIKLIYSNDENIYKCGSCGFTMKGENHVKA